MYVRMFTVMLCLCDYSKFVIFISENTVVARVCVKVCAPGKAPQTFSIAIVCIISVSVFDLLSSGGVC